MVEQARQVEAVATIRMQSAQQETVAARKELQAASTPAQRTAAQTRLATAERVVKKAGAELRGASERRRTLMLTVGPDLALSGTTAGDAQVAAAPVQSPVAGIVAERPVPLLLALVGGVLVLLMLIGRELFR